MASIEEVNTKDVVRIKNLNFRYDTGAPLNINGLDCVIPVNSKVILVGANGAGKSTLLRILTGVIYLGLESDEFDICGGDKPHDQAKGVAYLGGVWKRRRTGFEGIEPYSMDIAAREMMKKWQEENLERRDAAGLRTTQELAQAVGTALTDAQVCCLVRGRPADDAVGGIRGRDIGVEVQLSTRAMAAFGYRPPSDGKREAHGPPVECGGSCDAY